MVRAPSDGMVVQVALQPGMMQSDGIHPTADAQPLLLETFWQRVAPLLSAPLTAPTAP